MGKLKSVIAVLATAALITVCGLFPNIFFFLADRSQGKEADFIPINPVRLEIKPELTSLGKLAVLCGADFHLELSEAQTNLTKEQVTEAVHKGLMPFTDTALISYVGENMELRPELFQVSQNPDLQAVVWLVDLTHELYGDPKTFTNIGLVIDDETGTVLAISYTCETPGKAPVGKEALSIFADIFFSGLGVADHSRYQVSDLEYAGDNGDAFRYCFTDDLWGEVFVDLYVHDHGFYVEFPDF